jgi:hypothetical protein
MKLKTEVGDEKWKMITKRNWDNQTDRNRETKRIRRKLGQTEMQKNEERDRTTIMINWETRNRREWPRLWLRITLRENKEKIMT